MNSTLPPIAYISEKFPSLTTTFIYREVLALRAAGFEIETFATWKPALADLSAESTHLVESSHYVFPASPWKFLRAHARFLARHPLRYLRTLFLVLTRPGESPSNRKRTLFHFAEAMILAEVAEQRGIQHIHAHFSINAATLALVISRMLNISFSMTVHNNIFTDRILLREKLRAARFIISISKFSQDYLLARYADEKIAHKFHIVHCGVSTDAFQPVSPGQPASGQSEGERPLIFAASQFAERKGYPVLVEACRILRERGCRFECIIGGDGPQWAEVAQMVEQYELHDYVSLPGRYFQEQLRAYLERADIYVLPCITAPSGDIDGVPVSLMEAMAMELPVISTFVSGIPELVENGESGLLVEEKDAVALADAIQHLLENPARRAELGRRARQKVEAEYNIYANAEQLAEIFKTHLTATPGLIDGVTPVQKVPGESKNFNLKTPLRS